MADATSPLFSTAGVHAAALAQRKRLVSEHLWLVRQEARRYSRPGLPLEDLLAEGQLGLLRAAERWVPGSSPFGAFARLWVRGCIRAWADRERVTQSEGEDHLAAVTCERPSPEEVLGRAQRAQLTREWLAAQWPKLDAREKLILSERLLAEDLPTSTARLAQRLGLSSERVRQLERALLLKLRKRLVQYVEGEAPRAA